MADQPDSGVEVGPDDLVTELAVRDDSVFGHEFEPRTDHRDLSAARRKTGSRMDSLHVKLPVCVELNSGRLVIVESDRTQPISEATAGAESLPLKDLVEPDFEVPRALLLIYLARLGVLDIVATFGHRLVDVV